MQTIEHGDTVYLRHATDVSFTVQFMDKKTELVLLTDRNGVDHTLRADMVTKVKDDPIFAVRSNYPS